MTANFKQRAFHRRYCCTEFLKNICRWYSINNLKKQAACVKEELRTKKLCLIMEKLVTMTSKKYMHL